MGNHNPTLTPLEFLQKFPDKARDSSETTAEEMSSARIWGSAEAMTRKRKLNAGLLGTYEGVQEKVRWVGASGTSAATQPTGRISFQSTNCIDEDVQNVSTSAGSGSGSVSVAL